MISEWSDIELQRAIVRADYYASDIGTALLDALKEVERLRGLLIDVVDLINTSNQSAKLHHVTEADSEELLEKIDDIAHGYYTS